MALDRFSPSEVDHPGAVVVRLSGGSPSLGLKLLRRSRASISVPSTVKCSSDSSPEPWPASTTSSKNCLGRLVLSRRARFLVKRSSGRRALLQVHVQEPAEQQVVVELLAEQPLRAHRVQRDQQRRLEQPLGRDRGAADRCVHRIELSAHRREHRVGLGLHAAQRMIGRDALLDREVAEQTTLGIDVTTHPFPPSNDALTMTMNQEHCSRSFSTGC